MRQFILIIPLLLLPLLAGCNLESTGAATLTPLPPTVYVPPTPYRAPTFAPFGAQAVVITPTPGNLLTPIPAQTVIQNPQPSPTSQNAIEAFIDNLVIPAWNFLYTFLLEGLATLWVFAGARGGLIAQLACCVAPALLVIGAVLVRFRILRWR